MTTLNGYIIIKLIGRMKTRVIKKNELYYPQYLKTKWFGKYRRWCDYKYRLTRKTVKNSLNFNRKADAQYFIKAVEPLK